MRKTAPPIPTSLASIAACTLAGGAAVAAPGELDHEGLDAVTAGSRSTGEAAPAGDVSVVVADQSSITVQERREVTLHAQAQQQAAALNLVNAANADVANAVNVTTAMGARVIGRQVNDVLQIEHHYGRVERIVLSGPNLSRSYQVSQSYSTVTQSAATQISSLQTHSNRSVRDTYAAGVPGYFPLQNLSITLGTPDLPAVTVPAFGFDLTTSGDLGTFGIRGRLGPFTFDPPQIVLGTLSFQGDDLLIAGGYVDLPSLDLGSASITGCFVECGSVTVDLPTIDGPRIDLPGEWRFAGANPFKDVRINAGNGIAAAGQGHIVVDPTHVTLGAELTLDLPDLTTSFSFDVLGRTVSTGEFGVEIPPISLSVTFVNADIGPGYDAEFDGALCLSVQAGDCGLLQHSESIERSSMDIQQASASSSSSASGQSSSTGMEHITAGATLSGAEAELIAMSEGRAQVEQASVIALGAQAQRGMQVLNAVNATGAIVGNGVNVMTQRAGSAGLAQSNVFSQFKTRPRGP